MKNGQPKKKSTPKQEIVHVGFSPAKYKEIKRAADEDHRTVINYVQVCVIDATEARIK